MHLFFFFFQQGRKTDGAVNAFAVNVSMKRKYRYANKKGKTFALQAGLITVAQACDIIGASRAFILSRVLTDGTPLFFLVRIQS